MQPPDQLVAYARQIAVYRAYDNLVNGLQPLDVLNAKLEHEQEEFSEAVASGDIWHMYHEAADLLYYAACFDAQSKYDDGTQMPYYRYSAREYDIAGAGLNFEKAELAALAKYAWRASGPNRKDEEIELELIRNACQ